MAQGNVEFMAEVDDIFGFEGNSVVNNDVLRAAKSGKDIALKELNNGGVVGLSTWNGFNPFGEIIGGY